jgi:hypothetical protein
VNTPENGTRPTTAAVTEPLESPRAGGAELTDAELEAVAGGKDLAAPFAGGMGGFAGGFGGGYQRRGALRR